MNISRTLIRAVSTIKPPLLVPLQIKKEDKITIKPVYTGNIAALDGIEYMYFRNGVHVELRDIEKRDSNPVDLLEDFRDRSKE